MRQRLEYRITCKECGNEWNVTSLRQVEKVECLFCGVQGYFVINERAEGETATPEVAVSLMPWSKRAGQG